MAINLTKNKESIRATWQNVIDDKNANDWAIFGYEGQTNNLRVVSTGSGGLEEMIEDFNSGKIMYAFCKVIDPKTSLPKFVIINWQGEGAQALRKGICANHVRDVAKFFHGAHVSVNARTEDDVEPELIMEKVAKSTGSSYSFKERADLSDQTKPVGTVYKRIIPKEEINATERDKFWEKEEQEEKKRQAEERKKKEEELKKLEEDRAHRELQEAHAREEKIKQRTQLITQQREAEKNADNVKDTSEKERWERQLIDDQEDEDNRSRRSEKLKRQRSQEAQSVIATRTLDARAVFEKNTSVGQMQVKSKLPSRVLKDLQTNSTDYEENFIPRHQERKASLPSHWQPQLTSHSSTTVAINHSAETQPNRTNAVGRQWPPKTVIEENAVTVRSQPTEETTISARSEPIEKSMLPARSETSSISQQQHQFLQQQLQPEHQQQQLQQEHHYLQQQEQQVANHSNKQQMDSTSQSTATAEYHYTRNLLKEGLPPRLDSEERDPEEEQDWDAPTLEEGPAIKDPIAAVLREQGQGVPVTIPEEAYFQQMVQTGGEEPNGDFLEESYQYHNQGLQARALYDYQAADDTEISFDPDDIITHIDQIDSGWWQGMGPDGTYGLFPANYVELII